MSRQFSHQEFQLKEQKCRSDLRIQIIAERLLHPMNIAHIFRLSDALCIDKIYFLETKSFDYNKVRKLSRNCMDYIPYAMTDSFTEIETCGDLFALELTDKSESIFEVSKPVSDFTLIIGSERNGVSDQLLEASSRHFHIPMHGNNSSMNVAMAAGIGLYSLI